MVLATRIRIIKATHSIRRHEKPGISFGSKLIFEITLWHPVSYIFLPLISTVSPAVRRIDRPACQSQMEINAMADLMGQGEPAIRSLVSQRSFCDGDDTIGMRQPGNLISVNPPCPCRTWIDPSGFSY
jgi:hypothetical protein